MKWSIIQTHGPSVWTPNLASLHAHHLPHTNQGPKMGASGPKVDSWIRTCWTSCRGFLKKCQGEAGALYLAPVSFRALALNCQLRNTTKSEHDRGRGMGLFGAPGLNPKLQVPGHLSCLDILVTAKRIHATYLLFGGSLGNMEPYSLPGLSFISPSSKSKGGGGHLALDLDSWKEASLWLAGFL